jgi:hypothetical protein
MRTIAYKLAENSVVKVSLPSNFITEWTYTDIQPEGTLNVEDGWLFLPEEEFNLLFSQSNSEEVLNAYRQQEEVRARLEAEEALAYIREQQEQIDLQNQQLQQEFEEFLLWKNSQNPS